MSDTLAHGHCCPVASGEALVYSSGTSPTKQLMQSTPLDWQKAAPLPLKVFKVFKNAALTTFFKCELGETEANCAST